MKQFIYQCRQCGKLSYLTPLMNKCPYCNGIIVLKAVRRR